jgi:N-acetylmuramoyl-L-alanine amidase
MHENQHGIITVVIAYVLSAAMLVLGSDAFYNINSAAAGISMDTEEETNVIGMSDRAAQSSTDPSSSLLQAPLINPYHLEEDSGLMNLASEDISGYEDTVYLFGITLADTDYQPLMEKMQGYVAERKEIELAAAKKAAAKKAAAKKAEKLESLSVQVASSSKTVTITKADVTMLERIVEAEAGGEDQVGKILIANVIFNRIIDKHFPDSVEAVIFQKNDGDYQFSPVKNGRYWSVDVSKDTKKAVERALSGEDFSEGALYFVARKRTTSSSVRWFDNNLEWLFKHGGHEFYR